MKINPVNYFGADSTVCALKNEIMEAVWNTIGYEIKKSLSTSKSPFDTERYYELNRKISDSLDKFIQTASTEFRIDKRRQSHVYKEEILYNMTSEVAKHLFESDFLAVRHYGSDLCPEEIFKLEVPFLKVLNKEFK